MATLQAALDENSIYAILVRDGGPDVRYPIEFYRDRLNRCQACDYVRVMDERHRAKMQKLFALLSRVGPEVPSDYGKRLSRGVWELRVAIEHHQHRFLFVFRRGRILVTHAFLKKTQRVPQEEIRRALFLADAWEAAHGSQEAEGLGEQGDWGHA